MTPEEVARRENRRGCRCLTCLMVLFLMLVAGVCISDEALRKEYVSALMIFVAE